MTGSEQCPRCGSTDIAGAPVSVGVGGPALSALLAVERATEGVPRARHCRHCGHRWTAPSIAAERNTAEQELDRRVQRLQGEAERLRRGLPDNGGDGAAQPG